MWNNSQYMYFHIEYYITRITINLLRYSQSIWIRMKKKIFKYRRNFTQAHMCTVLSNLGFGLSTWMEMESTKIAFYCPIDHKSLRLILNIARKLSFNNSFEILKVYRLGTTRFRFESWMNVGKVLSQRNMGCLAYFKRHRPHIMIICKHTKILLLRPGEI